MDLSEHARADALEAEIQRVETMSLPDLRTLWTARWGAPPRFRSVDLLRRLIAWRLQAELFGGLDADTKRLLRRSAVPQPTGLPSGSRLTREFRSVLHYVDVGERAFTYQGTRYRSLWAVARTSTGTRWNGPKGGVSQTATRLQVGAISPTPTWP